MSVTIFCGDHFGSLSQLISLTADKDRTVFLVSSDDENQMNRLMRFQEQGLFEVVYYHYKQLSSRKDADGLADKIVAYFMEIFLKNNLRLSDVDEIFVSNSSAYCVFELFLCIEKIPYKLVEFAKNEFYSERLLKSIGQYGDISEAYKDLVKENGTIVGDNRFCVEHVYIYESCINGKLGGRNRKVDYSYCLTNLDHNIKKRIFNVYEDISWGELMDFPMLLLPNSESLTKKALKMQTGYYHDMILPYTLLVDLFGEENKKLIIKPHPYGNFNFYQYFSDAVILDKTFPIELLLLIKNIEIGTELSVETSASDRLKCTVKTNFALGRYFMLYINKVVELMAMVSVLEKSGIKKAYLLTSVANDITNIVTLLLKKRQLPAGLLMPVERIPEENKADVIFAFEREELQFLQYSIKNVKIKRRISDEFSPIREGYSCVYLCGELKEEDVCSPYLTVNLKYSRVKVEVFLEGGK